MKTVLRLLVFLSANFLFAEEIKLAEKGNALMPIVIPDSPTDSEKFAAEELKEHLDKIAGADFKILSASAAEGDALFVGDSPAARKILNFDPSKAAPDEIRIKTSGNSVAFGGHPKRGTLFAVYTFLEDALGVRWWTSAERSLPKEPNLSASELDISYAPHFIERRCSYLDAVGRLFAMRHKASEVRGASDALSKTLSDYTAVGCHSYYRILPPKKYFKDHPEWYSWRNKQKTRICEDAQLCLTNKEMRKEFLKNTLEYLRRNPNAAYVHISQNDHFAPCECEKCKAFEDAHGGVYSATNIDFANYIAEVIEKEFPNVRVVTFAYQHTRKPPTGIKPRANVCIELCSIECDFAHPLETDTEFSFTQDLRDWSKLTNNLFIWNYVAVFWNYMLPNPNMTNIAADIRFFKNNGAAGVYEQGDSFCSVGDFCRLRYWVIMHLLWDASRDQKALEREFLYGYYGNEVGKIFEQYLNIINACASRTNYAQNCNYIDTLTWLDVKSYNECAALMQKALETAEKLEKSSPEKYAGLAAKVRREKIPIDLVGVLNYVQLNRLAEAEGIKVEIPADLPAAVEDIITRWDEFGAKTWRELGTPKMFNDYRARLRNTAKQQTQYLALAPKKSESADLKGFFKDGCFAEFQEDFINQSNPPKPERIDPVPCDYIADKAASNGFAAKLSDGCEQGRHFDIPLRASLLNLKSASADSSKMTFRIYVWLRTQTKQPKGAQILVRVSTSRQGTRVMKAQPIARLASDKYTMIDLGTFDLDLPGGAKSLLTKKLLLTPSRTDKNAEVLLDRVVIVRE